MSRSDILRRFLCALGVCCAVALAASSEDWPTYRHDNRRSGVTPERLDFTLKEQWVHCPAHAPQPAWSGPAKWDAYAGVVGLRSMRNYDPVFHAIAVGGKVYFGSSAEDCVVCLDSASGAEQWRVVAEGPVRMPPAFDNGKLFFGADDGFARCIDAQTGDEVWRFSPAKEERFVPNNGKLVSMWPCRTGVLVDEGTAYFGAALVPWEDSYLCAVSAAKGTPDGEGLYVRTVKNVTMEGAMLASPTKLYVPQGRSAPIVFARKNAANLGVLEGGGGVFAVLSPDFQIAHGPGNKRGWLTVSNAETRDKIASYNGGNAMIVTEDRAYILKDTELEGIDRAAGKSLWAVPCTCPFTVILTGGTLVAGGANEVAAFNAADGAKVWAAPVSGRAYGIAAGNGALYVSTDTGAIHCFR